MSRFFNYDSATKPRIRFPKQLIAAINTQRTQVVADVLSTGTLASSDQLSDSITAKLLNGYGKHLAQPLQYLLLKSLYTEDESLESGQTTQCGIIAYLTEHYEEYQTYMREHGYTEPNLTDDYQFALALEQQKPGDNTPYPKALQVVDAFLFGLPMEKRGELESHLRDHFIPKL